VTTLLITGFGRFPGAPTNPSGTLARALARRRRTGFDGVERVAHVFATSYAAVDRDLPKLIAKHRPAAVILFGLAGRTRFVRIETQARNAMSLLFPDVDGVVPAKARIAARAPSYRCGAMPFPRLLAAARATGVSTRFSRDAGRYICNYVYWRAIEAAAKPGGPSVVFVHVPKVRSGPRARRGKHRPMMTAADLARVGDAIVRAIASTVSSNGGRAKAKAAPKSARSRRR
jgi:pyroglutamyl-peptidase